MSEQGSNVKAAINDFDLSAIDSLAATLSEAPQQGERVLSLDPKKTRDNPYQPRKERNAAADADLADSVKQHGVQQPIIVLPEDEEGVHTLVFGHRRRDAALAASVPCPAIERQYNDEQLRVLSLIENLQREDMAVKDEVAAVADLAASVGNKQAASLLGRKSQYVSKIVKISKSPKPIQALLGTGYSTDIAAFYELALLHNKDEKCAQKIIDRWVDDPGQRVSLRSQVAEEKAKLEAKEEGATTEKKPAKAKAKARQEKPESGSIGFEASGFSVEKLAKGGVKLVLEVGDGSTVNATFSKAMWSELRNAVNS
ncbi:MAG: ParB/RepB/Spo0J family partition protein [Gammaproteobacteria bacterium]|nr:ParB/RepB/Spo0J family partition protein [Gammaproteobacteria bacterium]MCP5090305.1 ParB/RepB/Spo0J family partition protein [Gammaproteobacteria bacterium]